MIISLNVYGVVIQTECNKDIAGWISNDYGHYESKMQDKTDLYFKLLLEQPDYSRMPEIKATKYHEDYIVYDTKRTRIIDYFGKAVVIYNTKEKRIKIICSSKEKLYEIFCISFESLLGDELDRKKFHRIHCLSLAKDGKAAILLLPPGAGKSTLAIKFLEHEEIKVLSEDIALFKNRKLYGLHFSWGTREKTGYGGRLSIREKYPHKFLIDTRKLKLVEKAKPEMIIFGNRILSEQSRIYKISKAKIIMPLFKSMVLGLDLQQSLAYFLLRNYKEAFSKTNVGISRLKALIAVLFKTRSYAFDIGTDVDKNYNLLKDFLQKKI